ncbi:phosphoribosylanthranilate isomerase [Candidatus Vidania fulgoroideorum]
MFTRTRVKFCGIRKKKEFLHSIKLGVDYVGFVFVKNSRRYINPKKVKKITNVYSEFPFIKKIGVFLNPDFNYVAKAMKESGVDIVQLHINYYKDSIIKKIKSKFTVIESFDLSSNLKYEYIKKINNKKEIFLLDNKKGGTGSKFDWRIIKKIKGKNFFVSGGLNFGNVTKLIRNYKPYAVDVSSGIESEGNKSINLMKKFISKINESNKV